jgi:hypothetical protein
MWLGISCAAQEYGSMALLVGAHAACRGNMSLLAWQAVIDSAEIVLRNAVGKN